MAQAAPPEAREAALLAVIDGATQAEAAAVAGVKQHTVSRWLSRLQERLERYSTRLRVRATRNVLRGIDRMTAARIEDASDVASRTGAMSYNALMTHALPKGPDALTIVGDVTVDQSTVNVDARSVQLTAGDAELRRAEAARLDALLGL